VTPLLVYKDEPTQLVFILLIQTPLLVLKTAAPLWVFNAITIRHNSMLVTLNRCWSIWDEPSPLVYIYFLIQTPLVVQKTAAPL